jgi:hypothetical protein
MPIEATGKLRFVSTPNSSTWSRGAFQLTHIRARADLRRSPHGRGGCCAIARRPEVGVLPQVRARGNQARRRTEGADPLRPERRGCSDLHPARQRARRETPGRRGSHQPPTPAPSLTTPPSDGARVRWSGACHHAVIAPLSSRTSDEERVARGAKWVARRRERRDVDARERRHRLRSSVCGSGRHQALRAMRPGKRRVVTSARGDRARELRAARHGSYRPAPRHRPDRGARPSVRHVRASVPRRTPRRRDRREYARAQHLLENHLLPFFGALRLTQITWSAVDSYKKQRIALVRRIRAARTSGHSLRDARNRPLRLSERTINMSIGLLAMILVGAVRRPDVELAANLARNTARSPRRARCTAGRR